MSAARLRLLSLWVAHVARVMADNCLRIYVALEFARLGEAERVSAWHLVTLIMMVPAVLLAPVNGAICNSLAKRAVLAVSGLVALGGVVAAWLGDFDLLACWGLVALTSALHLPARTALLPAAARDACWPLTRINGVFELGTALAIVGGLLVGASGWAETTLVPPLEAVTLLLGLSAIASLPVYFASDVSRPESPRQALTGFFADCRRIWHVPQARGCLIGLSALRGLMTGLMGALLAIGLADEGFLRRLLDIGVWLLGGAAAGSLLAGLQRHPRRVLGLAPWGATGLTIGLVIAALGDTPGHVLCTILGMMYGLVNVPLAATYQRDLPPDARGNGMAIRNFADYVLTAVLAGGLFALGRWAGWSPRGQLGLLAGVAGLLALASWCWLIGPVFEQFLEFLIWPIYRIKGYGPGLESMPTHGPVLVVANHTAWMDPVWAAKALPRRLIGMLTSVFFDIPTLRWVFTHVAETIRVQLAGFRREVPELKEAIAVLDRGDCVLIFPEGALRKKEEQLLKQFGQGVWHILNERPQTPVVVCWMEGGWGSYFSYFQGPPTKNKRFDLWRRIRVGVSDPIVMPPEVLADHRATRSYLMQACLEARRHLGLEVPSMDKNKMEGEAEDGKNDE